MKLCMHVMNPNDACSPNLNKKQNEQVVYCDTCTIDSINRTQIPRLTVITEGE